MSVGLSTDLGCKSETTHVVADAALFRTWVRFPPPPPFFVYFTKKIKKYTYRTILLQFNITNRKRMVLFLYAPIFLDKKDWNIFFGFL